MNTLVLEMNSLKTRIQALAWHKQNLLWDDCYSQLVTDTHLWKRVVAVMFSYSSVEAVDNSSQMSKMHNSKSQFTLLSTLVPTEKTHLQKIVPCIMPTPASKRKGFTFHLPWPPWDVSACKSHKAKVFLGALSHRVSAKIEEGNIKGAVRLICSEELIEDDCDEASPHVDSEIAPLCVDSQIEDDCDDASPHVDSEIAPLCVDSQGLGELDVLTPSIHYAILSFPCESVREPDGLTLEHLKNMIGPPAGEGGSAPISALISLLSIWSWVGKFWQRFALLSLVRI